MFYYTPSLWRWCSLRKQTGKDETCGSFPENHLQRLALEEDGCEQEHSFSLGTLAVRVTQSRSGSSLLQGKFQLHWKSCWRFWLWAPLGNAVLAKLVSGIWKHTYVAAEKSDEGKNRWFGGILLGSKTKSDVIKLSAHINSKYSRSTRSLFTVWDISYRRKFTYKLQSLLFQTFKLF